MLGEKDDQILEQSGLVEGLEKDIGKYRLAIVQHGAKVKTLNQTIWQGNERRRILGEELDRLQIYRGRHAMTKNNYNLGKLDLTSGGAGGQVEHVAAKPSWPSLPTPDLNWPNRISPRI